MTFARLALIIFWIRGAYREGGIWLSLIVAFAALILAAYAFNPIEVVEQEIAAPVGRSVGVLSSRCPGGWDDLSTWGDHAEVFICAKGNWRVTLNPDGKTFSHAVQLDTPGAEIIFDPAKVPGW